MEYIKLFAILLTLSIPFSSTSQELFAYVDNTSNPIITTTKKSKESIKEEEYKLTKIINQCLANSIKYPEEARNIGEEGMIRAVVIFSPDHSTTKLKIAKGTAESLKIALIEGYNKLNLSKIIKDNYRGKRAIPIKINFELD